MQIVNMLAAPRHIALLLPLSGALQEAGEALWNGFLMAYYQTADDARATVSLIDTEAGILAAYHRAITNGADFIIGPLTKDHVKSVLQVADSRIPTLTLNISTEAKNPRENFFQFALSPEDEARQVASRLITEGRRSGIVLNISGEWSNRVTNAFTTAFTAIGGTVVGTRTLSRDSTDMTDELAPLLGFEDSKRRFQSLTAIVGPLLFTPRHRDDISFVLALANASMGRNIRPQLKYQYAGDLPVYSISDIHDPNPAANQDMEGVTFTDMPWLIGNTPEINDLHNMAQQLWPERAWQKNRLFAMGYDSHQLMQQLANNTSHESLAIAGLTGRLTIGPMGYIHRTLDWAVFDTDGHARAI
jgi:outer membrane PBP1 activator LpoA protein